MKNPQPQHAKLHILHGQLRIQWQVTFARRPAKYILY